MFPLVKVILYIYSMDEAKHWINKAFSMSESTCLNSDLDL